MLVVYKKVKSVIGKTCAHAHRYTPPTPSDGFSKIIAGHSKNCLLEISDINKLKTLANFEGRSTLSP